MVYTSFRRFNRIGVERGSAGLDNYKQALDYPGVDIGRVFLNTFIWVAVVTVVSIVISLFLAQFLNKQFRGRKLVRLAVVVPWAASVVMTTSIFFYGLNPDYGIINRFLVDIGILDAPYGFTKSAVPAFCTAMVVAVFVSLPFTTYTILSGLQGVPDDVIEAAYMDGASAWQRYTKVILPMLRPAISIATLIMIINVFNSLPILQILVEAPGYDADITTTLIFKYKTVLGPGVASALSVVNFLVVMTVIAVYLAVLRPTKDR
ncbi:sugar ABC transporter permease [Motilibacter sp. K478]|nr:sugar ABC transporter permease [Motilibacter aurantiacus]NHC44505.1 sugar ABC transporter permease [Motilibacter aurantiacus]